MFFLDIQLVLVLYLKIVIHSSVAFYRQFAKKWILGSEFCKNKSECGISSFKIPYVPIFRQNQQLWLFWPKFDQKWILGLEFRYSKPGFGISTSNILRVSIFRQNGQLLFFRPKFAQKSILGSEFQNSKSGFGITTSSIPWVRIFRQNGQLWIFNLNLGKLPNYVRYFGSYNVEGVAES